MTVNQKINYRKIASDARIYIIAKHKNKNIQMKDTKCDAITNYFDHRQEKYQKSSLIN